MTVDMTLDERYYRRMMKRIRKINRAARKTTPIRPRLRTLDGVPMSKHLYKTFLRLNDRKKTQWAEDFARAGYHSATPNDSVVAGDWHGIHLWCERQYGPDGYTWTGDQFWFENERDQLLFLLRWS